MNRSESRMTTNEHSHTLDEKDTNAESIHSSGEDEYIPSEAENTSESDIDTETNTSLVTDVSPTRKTLNAIQKAPSLSTAISAENLSSGKNKRGNMMCKSLVYT